MIPVVYAGPFKVRERGGIMTYEYAIRCPDCGKQWIRPLYAILTLKAAQRYINKYDVHICAPK